MIYKLQVFLWSIVAELEYQLYPWKVSKPPQWAVDRYNVDGGHQYEVYEEKLNFDWLKHHEDKIAKLQLEMIHVMKEIDRLKKHG
jgi:hypothetical protein|tara:strand:+ start:8 stop:262 length:255 start_codon:yes stop_codon:yes gene_type:complete